MGESKGKVIAVTIPFMVLPVIVVLLRLWAKSTRQLRLTLDDYLVVLALIFTLGCGVCELVEAIDGNLGQHLTFHQNPEIPDQLAEVVVFLKAQYATAFLEKFALMCSKLSLICLYHQIFIKPVFRRVAWAAGILVFLWGMSFQFAFVFQCRPVAAFWNKSIEDAKCVSMVAILKAYAVTDVLTDALVLSLPIPSILNLQMPVRQKICVASIFLLGIIIIGTGIVRTVTFFDTAHVSFKDLTYIAASTMYWSFIETSLSTVCACLPTLGPLFTHQYIEHLSDHFRRIASFRSLKDLRSLRSSSAPTPTSHSPSVSSRQSFSEKTRDLYPTTKTTVVSQIP